MTRASIAVGDRVVCRVPGSWCDGMEATVLRLWFWASDAIRGHLVRIEGYGTTVVPFDQLEAIP